MFGLFKNKNKIELSISDKDKNYVEDIFIWFIERFGIVVPDNNPFIFPEWKNFPYNDLNEGRQFKEFLIKIADIYGIKHDEITVHVLDNIDTNQWTTWDTSCENIELGSKRYSDDERRFHIHITRKLLKNKEELIYFVSRSLSDLKMRYEGMASYDENQDQTFCEILNIFFGFGYFAGNQYFYNHGYPLYPNTEIPIELTIYSIALLCYISKSDFKDYYKYFNQDIRDRILNDYKYLLSTNDTKLREDEVTKHVKISKLDAKIYEAFENKDFDMVIDTCEMLIQTDKNSSGNYNIMGFAYLQKKMYEEAISYFNKAIDLDEAFNHAYNNRGYCRLQLGEYEDAFADIHSAYSMYPEDPYKCRNMGVYYLMTGNKFEALNYFQQAKEIDKKTELLYFFLGHTYNNLGDKNRAKYFFKQSLEYEEYNDSVLEDIREEFMENGT